MAERGDTAKVQLKVRLREPLRARLEAEAKKHDYSLNTEIVRRLEASVRDQDLGAVLFRDEQMFGIMDALARLIRAIELDTGHRWDEDRATYERAVETIYRFLKSAPHVIAKGEYPGGVRDIADYGALAAVELMIAKETERRGEDPEAPDQQTEEPNHA
jgi:hypothetical protein